MPENASQSTGGGTFDEMLRRIERAAEVDRKATHKAMDAHLDDVDRVIANVVKCKDLRTDPLEMAKAILENPT